MPGQSLDENLPTGAVVLFLPGLRQTPVIGGGCRAVAAEEAIFDELDSWPAIVSVRVDPQTETATVILDPALEDPLDAAKALRELGLPTVEILRRP